MSGLIIRCRHCDYQTRVWRSKGKGKKVNGFTALRRHMKAAHETELAAIEERVRRESVERFGPLPEDEELSEAS